jgi:hypothetical protein
MEEKDKYLRYGDLIVLSSTEEPRRYLTARSIAEESMFMIEPLYNLSLRQNIINYPNTSELIFTLYPKLYYEASKRFLKIED